MNHSPAWSQNKSPERTAQASRLGSVRKGRIKTGKRITVYGAECVGKTSFAADAPAPIFLDVEDGSSNLDVTRYSFRDSTQGHVPASYEDITLAVDDLRTEEHNYRTLVIDTIDSLEPLIWEYCCKRDSGQKSSLNQGGKRLISIESYGYGKGYVVALDVWRDLAHRLDRLRVEKDMNIILLSHSHIRTFKNPEGEDFDRYQLRIRENAASFIREWSDIVAFACFEGTAEKANVDDRKAKGYATGRRMLMLEYKAAYDAKTRIPMPHEIELVASHPWGPIGRAIADGDNSTPESLTKDLHAKLERLDDAELSAKVALAIESAKGDVAVLSRFRNELRRR